MLLSSVTCWGRQLSKNAGGCLYRLWRNRLPLLLCLSLLTGFSATVAAQNAELFDYFRTNIGLSQDQMNDIQNGTVVTKALKSRTSDEIFVFGAVYISAAPGRYVQFATDIERLRRLSEYLAVGRFSNPPQVRDLEGFSFDRNEIEQLKSCRPGHCEIQLPAQAIEDFHQSIDWTAPDLEQQVNQFVHQRVLAYLLKYQREGNRALGAYRDKEHSTDVAKQFEYILSYQSALPRHLPDFHRYLLSYPETKPANTEDSFYWSKVKFGLKPTLRLVHVVIWQGHTPDEPACVIAEKQLYSSHYFETALDLSLCIRDKSRSRRTGFYLIKVMGSEQTGLTGFKGSIVRKAAEDRSVSSLKRALTAIKASLEKNTP